MTLESVVGSEMFVDGKEKPDYDGAKTDGWGEAEETSGNKSLEENDCAG